MLFHASQAVFFLFLKKLEVVLSQPVKLWKYGIAKLFSSPKFLLIAFICKYNVLKISASA